MKVLLYSDVHISKTSSILPLFFDGSKYTYRQKMIIDTGKFLADVTRTYQPDIIINLGDTFDVHTLTSYDIVTASEFFKCFEEFTGIPHIVLVGNHEMVNHNFNAVEILNNIPNITVISEPCSMYNDEFAFLPYCNHTEILEFPKGKFLFSHQDIQGSVIRGNITMSEGITTEALRQNYQLVFNGHIHKSSISGNVINVGSITTHSFADDNDSLPKCYIFDTDTNNLEVIASNICPLFRKIEIDTLQQLKDLFTTFSDEYKYIINCSCPFELKEVAKEYLDNNNLVLTSRLTVRVDKNKKEEHKEDIVLQQSNLDIVKSFREFLDTIELKFPKQLYVDVLNKME